MRCDIGNDHAIEGYRLDPDDPKTLTFRALPGEQVTTFVFPPGMDITEAIQSVAITMGTHIQEGAVPAWVEADDPTLQVYLCALWHLDPNHKRPSTWGSPKTGDAKTGKSLASKTTKKSNKAGPPPELPPVSTTDETEES